MDTKLVNWSEKFSVGIAKIDEEHKQLFEYMNCFFQAFMDKKSESKIQHLISELYKYSNSHFEMEESLILKHKYPDSQTHILEHNKFRKRLSEFEYQYKNKEVDISLSLLTFLSNWIVNHILFSDKKYANYLKDNNLINF